MLRNYYRQEHPLKQTKSPKRKQIQKNINHSEITTSGFLEQTLHTSARRKLGNKTRAWKHHLWSWGKWLGTQHSQLHCWSPQKPFSKKQMYGDRCAEQIMEGFMFILSYLEIFRESLGTCLKTRNLLGILHLSGITKKCGR